jgi:hypothetical protein
LYFFATFTVLYAGTFTIHADKRSDAFTYFASMSEEALAADPGPDVKQLGSWNNPVDGSGVFVCEAKSVTALHEWMWKWTEDFATIKVSPILSDDMCREVVLGTKPAFSMSLDSLDDDPRDGQSLYIAHWKMRPEHKLKTYETFAGMTEEDEIKDRGNCLMLHRWIHVDTNAYLLSHLRRKRRFIFPFDWKPGEGASWMEQMKTKGESPLIHVIHLHQVRSQGVFYKRAVRLYFLLNLLRVWFGRHGKLLFLLVREAVLWFWVSSWWRQNFKVGVL